MPGIAQLTAKVRRLPHLPVMVLMDAVNRAGTMNVMAPPFFISGRNGIAALGFLRVQPVTRTDSVVLDILHDKLGGRANNAREALYRWLKDLPSTMVGQNGTDLFCICVRAETAPVTIPEKPSIG